ncbi:MAG: undecaprenyl-diphosphate phosphatase [Candidatus Hydrothermarchaeales archaeon]
MNLIEGLLIGTLQGIAEWLPISSSGQGMLVLIQFLGLKPGEAFSIAIFLHLGSLLAVLYYFRKELGGVIRGVTKPVEETEESRKIGVFLVVTTIFTALIGVPLYFTMSAYFSLVNGDVVTAGIGILLIITGLVLKKGGFGTRKIEDLETKDMAVVGLAQGFAILPGISRSGITIAALLMMKFDNTTSLILSFLMAIPAIIGAIILDISFNLFLNLPLLVGIAASFIVSLVSVDYLLKISRRLDFSKFCIFIGIIAFFFPLVNFI